RIEIRDLPRELGAKAGSIEARDRTDPDAAFEHRLPELLYPAADRTHRADSGNDDAMRAGAPVHFDSASCFILTPRVVSFSLREQLNPRQGAARDVIDEESRHDVFAEPLRRHRKAKLQTVLDRHPRARAGALEDPLDLHAAGPPAHVAERDVRTVGI